MGEVLSVSELKKTYEVRRTAFSRKKDIIKAVDSVSLHLEKGHTIGIVGESGSGKSTLARCIMLLERPDEGKIIFKGLELTGMKDTDLRPIRKAMQIIFQDPYSSLNPRKKVFDVIAEPLLFHGMVNGGDVRGKTLDILNDVGLGEDFLDKYPHEMSGGQRQRVAIGRALATNPELIVADEPVSSLDVSIQAQIVNLFLDIKEKSQISMLFVSHDLNIVHFISDEIIVMYKGKVVESGLKNEVFYKPLHPYTKMLIESIGSELAERAGDDTGTPNNGCAYYPRCERKIERCSSNKPLLTGDKEHSVACFI